MIILSFREEGEVYETWGINFTYVRKLKLMRPKRSPSPGLEKQEARAGGGGCDQPTCQVRVSDKPSCADSSRVAGFVSWGGVFDDAAAFE